MGQPLEWVNCNQNIASIGLELKKGKLEGNKKRKQTLFCFDHFEVIIRLSEQNTHIKIE
jgi:hypothetical protein